MSKTVKDHLEDCKQVSQIIDNANALLTKCQRELFAARAVLESLRDYQHPKLNMEVPHQVRTAGSDRQTIRPSALIDTEVQRINQLLGDRA